MPAPLRSGAGIVLPASETKHLKIQTVEPQTHTAASVQRVNALQAAGCGMSSKCQELGLQNMLLLPVQIACWSQHLLLLPSITLTPVIHPTSYSDSIQRLPITLTPPSLISTHILSPRHSTSLLDPRVSLPPSLPPRSQHLPTQAPLLLLPSKFYPPPPILVMYQRCSLVPLISLHCLNAMHPPPKGQSTCLQPETSHWFSFYFLCF